MSAAADEEVLDTEDTWPGGPGRIAALDGLRAIAVLAVMLFHTASAPLAGGYLGVDIFFVLSGFLIAGILLDQLARSGRVRLTDFWLRRARRLAPALLLLLFVLCLSRIAVVHSAADIWRGDVLAALAYVTNWFLIATGADYFDQFGEQSPLLHTWSLAIEEQFYLGFAVLLVLLLRRASRRVTLATFAVLTVLSAVWMFVLAGRAPAWAYFSTGTRVQALLVGAVLAVLVRRLPRWWAPEASRGRSAIGWAGVVVLGIALVADIPNEVMFRGGFLVVAVASAAIIWGALGHSGLAIALSWRPLVLLGVVSYGVYLWHWPVFLWLQARGDTGLARQAWAMIVSVLLAATSYLLVERPLREGRFRRLPSGRQWGSYALAALLIVGLVMLPARTLPADETLRWPAASDVPDRIFVAGDSTMMSLAMRFPSARYPEATVDGPTRIGCGLMNMEYMHTGASVNASQCYDWPEQWQTAFVEREPNVAVVGSLVWDTFDRAVGGVGKAPGTTEFDDAYRKAFGQAITIAGDNGRIPVYVLGVPCMDALIDQEILNDPARTGYLSGLVQQAVSQATNAHYVDLRPLTCKADGTAIVFRDGRKLREDGVHWTPAGAEEVWSLVLQQMAAGQRAVPGD